MPLKKSKPQTVAGYIAAAPKTAQKKLREMRVTIRKAAPGATESIKWGMPSFSYKRMLVAYAAYQHHIGFYPTPSAVKAFKKDIEKFVWAKGSVQFPLDKPLPLSLIRKMTLFRVHEAKEKDAKWRS